MISSKRKRSYKWPTIVKCTTRRKSQNRLINRMILDKYLQMISVKRSWADPCSKVTQVQCKPYRQIRQKQTRLRLLVNKRLKGLKGRIVYYRHGGSHKRRKLRAKNNSLNYRYKQRKVKEMVKPLIHPCKWSEFLRLSRTQSRYFLKRSTTHTSRPQTFR